MTTKSRSECGVPSPLTIEPARKSTLASGYLLSKISFATLTRLIRNSVLFLINRVSHRTIEFIGASDQNNTQCDQDHNCHETENTQRSGNVRTWWLDKVDLNLGCRLGNADHESAI